MEKQRLASVLVLCLVTGTLFCTPSTMADFHEYFEGPTIDITNWTVREYGGLDAVQAGGKLYINGTYDPMETAPNTGGHNQYRLIFNQSFSGFLDISVTSTVLSLTGDYFGVGIGIMNNDSVPWDNITSWVQRLNLPTENAIGWVDSWHNMSDVKVTFDGTDITLGVPHTHRMIHHENKTVQFILDGVTKGWLPINLSSFRPFLITAILKVGSAIETVFDDYHIITAPPTAVLQSSKTNFDKDEIIGLDASSSFYEGGSIASYYFDFGDGQNSGWTSNSIQYHNYSIEGTYLARLKVLGDNGKESNWSEVTLCVDCAIPIANLTADTQTIGTLGSVEFSGIQSTDSDGEILGYFFDYGDWSDSGWIMSPYSNYSYWDDGIYDARLKVLDDDGHESNWSEPVTITVLNEAPIPLYWYSNDHVNQKENVTFDGDKSFDPDGWVTSWFFDFGDGTDTGWISYPNVIHAYQDIGEYMVSLKVRDNDGMESTLTRWLWFYVHNTPPNALLTAYERDIVLGTNVSLDGSNSYDLDGIVAEYLFDFDDGTDSGWIISPTTRHTYLDEGFYDIKLKVRDDDGAESLWSTVFKVQVYRTILIPRLNTTTPEVSVGEEVYLDGRFSLTYGGIVSAFNFDFGDGSTTGWIAQTYATHVYSEAGEYAVTLRVRDFLGEESEYAAELTITVLEEEEAPDEFNWWMVLAIILLVLLIVAILIVLRQRKELNELGRE